MFRYIFGRFAQHRDLNRFVAMLGFTAVMLSILVVANVSRADAAPVSGTAALETLLNPNDVLQQRAKQLPRAPYGGCDEAWQAPHSLGAQDCRDMGWTIRPRLLVNPRGLVIMSRLPHCTFEDASSGPVPCSYNFGRPTDGFGGGLSFWVTGTNHHNRTHYVWTTRPHNGWAWVSRSLADALAESGAKGADSRAWEQCKVKTSSGTVRCADGVVFR